MQLQPGTVDLALDALSPELTQTLHQRSCEWFNSLAFCRWFVSPPVQRVRIWVDFAGAMTKACFYREEAALARRLFVSGPISLSADEFRALLQDRNAHGVVVGMMPPDGLDHLPRNWRRTRPRPVTMSVIHLPDSADAYLKSLGAQTRKHLPYYVRRIQKQWPGVQFIYAQGAQITRELMQDVVSLSRARIESKGDVHGGFSGEVFENRFRLAQESALLCGVIHEGRLVAGTLSYLHGPSAFLALIGHDPQHNRLNLGNACLWLSVQRLIEMRIRRYNLLWGSTFYKQQFGGVEETAYELGVCPTLLGACAWRLLDARTSFARNSARGVNLARRIIHRVRSRTSAP